MTQDEDQILSSKMASTSILPEDPYPPFTSFRQEVEADLTDTYPDDISNHTASTRDNRHPRGDSPLSFRRDATGGNSTRGESLGGRESGREVQILSLSGLLDFLDDEDATLSEDGEYGGAGYERDERSDGGNGNGLRPESRDGIYSASLTPRGRYRLSSTPPPDHNHHFHHPDLTPQPHPSARSTMSRIPHERSHPGPTLAESERGVKNGSTTSTTEHDQTMDQSSPSFHLSARNGNGNGKRDWNGKGKERAREEEERDGLREDGRYGREGRDGVHDDVSFHFSVTTLEPESQSNIPLLPFHRRYKPNSNLSSPSLPFPPLVTTPTHRERV